MILKPILKIVALSKFFYKLLFKWVQTNIFENTFKHAQKRFKYSLKYSYDSALREEENRKKRGTKGKN